MSVENNIRYGPISFSASLQPGGNDHMGQVVELFQRFSAKTVKTDGNISPYFDTSLKRGANEMRTLL